MISSKSELKFYIKCDRIALGIKKKRPSFFGDEIWKYIICMRKLAYYQTTPFRWGGMPYLLSLSISSPVVEAGLFNPLQYCGPWAGNSALWNYSDFWCV